MTPWGYESIPRCGCRRLVARAGAFLAGCRGGLMLETVIAVAVLGLVGTAVLAGLSTTQSSGAKTEGQSVAENIARNQMEHIFALPFQDPPSTYSVVATPAGYGVTAQALQYVPGDVNIEKLVVTVTRGAQELLVLETLRTRE